MICSLYQHQPDTFKDRRAFMSRGIDKVLDVKWWALFVVAMAILVLIFTQGAALCAAKADTVDINSATQAELEAVKGVGPVTAQKIIDNRPYNSLSDLKKAGLSPKEITVFKPYLIAKPASAATTSPGAKTIEPGIAITAKGAKAAKPAPGTPVNLNTADKKALESLPGVGPTLAQRIIEARPIQNLDELVKVKGMSKTKVEALKDKVTFGAAVTAAPPAPPAVAPAAKAPPAAVKPMAAPEGAAKTQPTTAAKGKVESPKLTPGEKININTATLDDLDKLLDIGPVKAKAIIKGRPYKTPEDIMKVKGIKGGIYNKIKDHITVK
jgi:competence ComEA-like helix-hairpin-helix protein